MSDCQTLRDEYEAIADVIRERNEELGEATEKWGNAREHRDSICESVETAEDEADCEEARQIAEDYMLDFRDALRATYGLESQFIDKYRELKECLEECETFSVELDDMPDEPDIPDIEDLPDWA